MTGPTQQELRDHLEALKHERGSSDEEYRGIYQLGKARVVEAIPAIAERLTDPDPILRRVALLVLTLDFHLMPYWGVARDLLMHDPDTDVRSMAAAALGALKSETRDSQTLRVLARVVRDESEDDLVRESAYQAMRLTVHFDPEEQETLTFEDIDWAHDVDWEFVDSCIVSPCWQG